MKRVKMGIGTKIYFGFMALIVVALVIGGAGFLSLNRVVRYGELNAVARDIQAKILEARNLEKTYVLTKSQDAYEKLIKSLEDLNTLTVKLKTVLDETKKAEEIAAGDETYKTAVASLKQLDAADEQLLKDLQDAGKKIKEIAENEAARIAGEIKENVLQTTTAYLKDKALDATKQVVAVGYDVLKYYHERGLPKADALETIRNLHFSGNNYFFVVQEDLILVAHGSDRSLEGKDFGKIQDKKTGKTFMRELVDNTLKTGESFTEYFWNKPGMGDAIFPKITYAKSFKPWGLVVCAGIYVDDLEKQVAAMGETIAAGLAKMQQAEAIKELNLEARLNATNYFAFGKNEEDVAVNLGKLKQLPIASGALRKEADQFLAAFNRRVENSQTRKTNIAQIDQVAAKTLKISDEVQEMAKENYLNATTSGKTIIVGFIVFGILAGLALATILARSIIRPIRHVIAGIEESSDQVASAAGQVSSASQQLAEGSSEQAASLEETSSALEEITSMTKQNADNANQANRLMVESNQIVQKANHTMVNLTASMNEISKASEETQKIIKTIDEIAFQTNLLALNAAVEAARAGEAGAGFAVVADEVRNLALRAAEAARNTADLIEGTVKKVKEGSALVEMTNGDFKEMATSVTKSGELVGEIAAASQEQAQGISQVSNAVAEMDRVVQQNAANAEESAAAAEQMSAQAEHMKALIKEMVDLVGVDRKKATVPKKKKGKIQQLRTITGKATPIEEVSVKKQAPVRHPRLGEKKGNGGAREVKPEQVIPFDEDLRDF